MVAELPGEPWQPNVCIEIVRDLNSARRLAAGMVVGAATLAVHLLADEVVERMEV